MRALKVIARTLASGLLVASGLLIILLLYVLLGEKPYGIQIVTLIAYSMGIFFFVFHALALRTWLCSDE